MEKTILKNVGYKIAAQGLITNDTNPLTSIYNNHELNRFYNMVLNKLSSYKESKDKNQLLESICTEFSDILTNNMTNAYINDIVTISLLCALDEELSNIMNNKKSDKLPVQYLYTLHEFIKKAMGKADENLFTDNSKESFEKLVEWVSMSIKHKPKQITSLYIIRDINCLTFNNVRTVSLTVEKRNNDVYRINLWNQSPVNPVGVPEYSAHMLTFVDNPLTEKTKYQKVALELIENLYESIVGNIIIGNNRNNGYYTHTHGNLTNMPGMSMHHRFGQNPLHHHIDDTISSEETTEDQ